MTPLVCDCADCAAFPPPATPCRGGKHGPPIAWRGKWWCPMPSGHYRHGHDGLLHRAIWIAHYGEIPDADVIHHRNRTPWDNRLANLERLDATAHRHHHTPDRGGFMNWTTEQHRANGFASWEGREPRPYVCGECGTSFTSTNQRARWCSRRCGRLWRARVKGVRPRDA